jgi:predicted N-acetyltransferase YhbS
MTLEERGAPLSRPAALERDHDVSAFDCGRPELTAWLKDWGHRSAEADTTRTFVICRGAKTVIGYFSLAAGAVAHVDLKSEQKAPRNLRQNAADPIPIIILARLAVDRSEQGKQLGSALVVEAMRRAALASTIIGARALLVHALDDGLVAYYQSLGFVRFNPTSRTLYMTTRSIRDAL